MKNIWIYAAGAAILLALANRKTNYIPEMTEEDRKFLQDAGPKKLQQLLKTDDSPMVFETRGNTELSPEEVQSRINVLKKKYLDDQQLNKLTIDPDVLAGAILAMIEIENKEVRERSLQIYTQMFLVWAQAFAQAADAYGNGVAQVLSSAVSQYKTKCTKWTWIKKTHEEVHQSDVTSNTVSKSNSSWSVGFGLLGSGGKGSSTYTTIRELKMSEARDVTWVPHCTGSQVDLDAAELDLIHSSVALKALATPVQAIADIMPTLKIKS